MHPVNAQDTPPELRGSGLPVPRFVSIGADKAFVRSGPAPRYPIKWIYRKDGLPVEVVEEFDVWRKIRDSQGDEGWINKALLSDRRFVIVRGEGLIDMLESPEPGARVVARMEVGVIGRLQKCTETLCQVAAGGFQGWVARQSLWGVYPDESFP